MNNSFTPEDIVFVYIAPWNFSIVSNRAQPLAKALSKFSTVIYINLIPSLESMIRSPNKFAKQKGNYNVIDYSSLYVYTPPPLMSWHRKKANRGCLPKVYERYFIKHFFKRFEKYFGNNKLVLITSRLWGKFLHNHFDTVIADIEDHWLHKSWFPNHQKFIEEVPRFLNNCDLVFANGEIIQQEYQQYTERDIVNFPNGVDFTLFNSVHSSSGFMMPEDLSRISKKKNSRLVMYTGSIDRRLDFNIFRYVANRATNFIFVFIGPIRSKIPRDILSCKNVIFLCKKDIEELPNYMFFADILWLLNKDIEPHNKTFPAKILEYMATGKPIISTRKFREVPSYLMKIAATGDETLKALEECLGDRRDNQYQRVKFAKFNSWQHRAKTIYNRLGFREQNEG